MRRLHRLLRAKMLMLSLRLSPEELADITGYQTRIGRGRFVNVESTATLNPRMMFVATAGEHRQYFTGHGTYVRETRHVVSFRKVNTNAE
jgi:hypothetical protein